MILKIEGRHEPRSAPWLDSLPYQVSRNHCAINMAPDGSLLIMDRGSTLGTIVNGKPIGHRAGTLEAVLTE